MPHLTVHALESDLAGREQHLITALTDAVAAAYGEWARAIAVVHLTGFPPGRWGVGGTIVTRPAPAVTFAIKEGAFAVPDAEKLIASLAEGVTAALTGVIGPRAGITVDFVGTLPGRSAVDGVLES